MKNVKLLVAAALLLVSALALAMDAPHDGSWADSVTNCQSCHLLHGATGGTLTKWPSNNDACLTCHDSAALTPNHLFTPAWSSAGMEAVPGTGGSQHKWSGSLTARGARAPTAPAFADYVAAGVLQCAMCHDDHGDKDASGNPIQDTYAPKSAHASYPFLVPQPPVSGTGAMELVSLTAASWAPSVPASAYTVRVESFAGSSGVLAVSHDYIKNPAAATWVSGLPFTVNAEAELDNANVVIRFTSNPSVGSIWQFYVSFPFLRATNVADAMCLDCHINRHQGYRCVEGDSGVTDGAGLNCAPDGVRTYSHPVNEPLGANGAGTDLAAPLDADGSAVDSNRSNDLTLDDGQVRCTTCHAPHNADSNSLTVDVR
jgi:predicted CXXCH cytochrome family protein